MIGIIAPYSDFKKEIKKIAATMNIPVVVEVGALHSGLAKAKKMIRKYGVKVIIARGVTANFLKTKLEIPIIKIDVTNYDIVRTLYKAKKMDNSVVLIDHIKNYKQIDLETISKMLKIKIDLKLYENEQDISNHIYEVAEQKESKPIVGTAECMEHTAGKKGIKSFIVFSQKDSMKESLLRAKETLENFSREREKQKHLHSIISNAFDGVISTNYEGEVTVCNEVAARYLGIHPTDIIGRQSNKIQLMLFKKLIGDFSKTSKKIIKHGNQNYVVNRVRLGGKSVVVTFQKTDSVLHLNNEIRSELYQRRLFAKYKFDDIIYRSAKMKNVINLAIAYAKSDSNILIYGESGTGKELFAQSIHNESSRKTGPFIAVNCAALPENLLESELFGYEDGAFTGAKKGGKPGLFEMAHGGTIFLDEIGDISPNLQARLLRVLQEKEVRRIGGERILSVDFRVISATNKNLMKAVDNDDFRRDLYYRLNVLQLSIPSLRERKEDILLLIEKLAEQYQVDAKLLSETTKDLLLQYDWPGNIRELENFIERLAAVDFPYHGSVMNLLDKNDDGVEKLTKNHKNDQEEYVTIKVGSMKEMEKQIIAELLHRYQGNRTMLANKLGISRTTLWKKMKVAD